MRRRQGPGPAGGAGAAGGMSGKSVASLAEILKPCGPVVDAAAAERAREASGGGLRPPAGHGRRWRRYSRPRPIWRGWRRGTPDELEALLTADPARSLAAILAETDAVGALAPQAGAVRAAAAEGAAAPADRALRSRRRLGPRRGDRRADPLCRRARSARRWRSWRARSSDGLAPAEPGAAGPLPGLFVRGARQDGRVRAELLQRHRHLGVLRAGRPAAGGRRRAPRLRDALHAGPRRACCRTAPATATCSGSTCACGRTRRPRRPPCRSTQALDYYESVGQNWERAAMIKARVCRRRHRPRRGLPRRAAALRLAPQPRLRRHRRHPVDQAPDPGPATVTSASPPPAPT